MAQFVPFFMAVMLNTFTFHMGSLYQQAVSLCKNVPAYSRKRSLFNVEMFSVMVGLGGSAILLFLLWNLVYLALA